LNKIKEKENSGFLQASAPALKPFPYTRIPGSNPGRGVLLKSFIKLIRLSEKITPV